LLQVTDVDFSYGTSPILRGVSLDVPRGGFVGVLGPNGSGKTTLLRVMSGTAGQSRGSVTLDGTDLARMPRAALARRMAVVPQETHPAFDYSVLEVVLMGRYPHLGTFELEGPDDYEAARTALAATGTSALADRQFATLSGGEKQRVVIASALAQLSATTPDASPVLLLDEPTAALDLRYQLEVAALLRTLQERTPLAIVVSTHDLNFAASLCRSLVLLKAGVVVSRGPTEEVLTPENIRALYDVEAEVHPHTAVGHLVVVPVRRVGGERTQ
jgi:ABC-type cobalamin/Fe3+-siderophores transport system ATPase subunit